MNELELLKLAGVGGGGMLAYFIIDRVLKFVRNSAAPNHQNPCADLQVVQSEVVGLKDATEKQWNKMETMSDTLSKIDGRTETILQRLPKK